jgi:hypothetical protein
MKDKELKLEEIEVSHTLCGYIARPSFLFIIEEIKRELKRIHIYGCRCNERLKAKTERSTRLSYNRLRGGLGDLKIETRLRDERFENVMGACVIKKLQTLHQCLE